MHPPPRRSCHNRAAPTVLLFSPLLPILLQCVSAEGTRRTTHLPSSASSPATGPPVMGIDFGASYSAVAVWHGGRVDIVPNTFGLRTTPSVVAFNGSDVLLIGEPAKHRRDENPGTITSVKRIMGKPFAESAYQLGHSEVTKGSAGEALLAVPAGEAGGRKFLRPEIAAAAILRHLRKATEDYLGVEVRDAVIAVPPHFSHAQRQAMRDASSIAGVRVLRLLTEPAAVAAAYGLGPHPQPAQGEARLRLHPAHPAAKKVLVYDMGAGLSVSALSTSSAEVELLASASNASLGGDALDSLLMRHALQGSPATPPSPNARLLLACEAAKRDLARAATTRIQVDVPEVVAPALHPLGGASPALTRPVFEGLAGGVLSDGLRLAHKVLRGAGLRPTDIDEVIITGGASRIPKVHTMMRRLFGGRDARQGVSPDEAVALGAAVHGASLRGGVVAGLGGVGAAGGRRRVSVAEVCGVEAAARRLRRRVSPGGDLHGRLSEGDRGSVAEAGRNPGAGAAQCGQVLGALTATLEPTLRATRVAKDAA